MPDDINPAEVDGLPHGAVIGNAAAPPLSIDSKEVEGLPKGAVIGGAQSRSANPRVTPLGPEDEVIPLPERGGNVFDQFDRPQSAKVLGTGPGGGNVFDQFDSPSGSTRPPGRKPLSWGETAADVAQSGATGIEKGAFSLLGLPGDAANLATRGWSWLIKYGADKLGYLTPAETSKWRKEALEATHVPGSEEYNQAVQDVAGPYYKPQSTAGDYAQTVGEFIPGSGARTLGGVALRAVVPGVASETAGQATKGTAAEPWARIAFGSLGSIPGIIHDWTSAPQRIVANATSELTDRQWQQVTELMTDARRMDTPITLAEAVQQVTNGGTRLGDIQRVVEQSGAGAPPMRRFMAGRATGNEAAARSTFDQVAPATTEPFEVAPRIQRAANSTIADTRAGINAKSAPYYASAETESVPLAQVRQLYQDPAIGEALKRVQADPVKAGAIAHLGIDQVGTMDAVKKEIDAMIGQARTTGDNHRVALLSDAKTRLTDFADQASSNYATARALQTEGRQTKLGPLERSPTGQLAAADTYPEQAKILFNPSPMPGSQYAVRDAVRSVAAKDPDAARDLVRMHLEQSFNEASQRLVSGENQWGAAKYAAVLRGNQQQATNLQAAVRALPNGDAMWTGLNRMLDIFEAQGRRQPAGSQTAFNEQLMKNLQAGGPGEVAALLASPRRWTDLAMNWYQGLRYGKNTDMLARILTSPDAVPELKKLATMSPTSDKARAVATNLVISRLAYERSLDNLPASAQQAQQPQPRADGGRVKHRPRGSVRDRLVAMLDPRGEGAAIAHGRGGVFLARGLEGAIPRALLSPKVLVVERPEGTLLTTHRYKARAFKEGRVDAARLALLLGE